jgi:hypothetical protein
MKNGSVRVEEEVMKDMLRYTLQPFYPQDWRNVEHLSDDGFD